MLSPNEITKPTTIIVNTSHGSLTSNSTPLLVATLATPLPQSPASIAMHDDAAWNEHILAWSKSRTIFDSENAPSWRDLMRPSDEPDTAINWPSAFPDWIPSSSPTTSETTLLESPPPPPFYIEPNHYPSNASLEIIRQQIEAFCSESKVSFEFTNMGAYTYKCVYIHRVNICNFWINLFTTVDGFIIEVQHMSGDGFCFIDVVRTLRYWLQINEVISNPNEMPYKHLDELKLSAGVPSSPSIFIDPFQAEETVRNLIIMASSPFTDIATEAIVALADSSSDSNILQALMSNPQIYKLIFTHIHSDESIVCYCILMIIKHILSVYPLSGGSEETHPFKNLLPEIIWRMNCYTLPQIWEKCIEILLLIDEPIDIVNIDEILRLLRSNPFPSLVLLAREFEAHQLRIIGEAS